MKKTLVFVLIMATVLSLAACSGSASPASPAVPAAPAAAKPAENTGGTDYTKGKPVAIKIAHVSQQGVPIDVTARKMGETLAEKSGGRIKTTVFPASQLGNNTENLEQLQLGTLEMTISSVAFLGGFTKKTQLLDLPYLFKSNGAAQEILDGKVGQTMMADLENSGFHGIGWFATGWRHLTANKEIRKPADIKGMKVRVMENQMHIDHFNQLGASAIPMAFSELYTALQNGTMDCQENPFANIDGNRLYEVQKYIIMTGHIYDTSPLLCSKTWWGSLTAADQELIQSVTTESVKFERELSAQNEKDLQKKLGENGKNVVVELTADERAAFRTAAQPVYDKYTESIGKDVLKMVDEINAKY